MLLDWPDADKGMLLAALPLPVLLTAVLRIEMLLGDVGDEPYLSRPTLLALRYIIAFYAACTGLLALLWTRLRRGRPDAPVFVSFCLALFFGTLAVGAYIVGHFSTPVLGGCVAGAIAVLLLFDPKVARPAVWAGTFALFAPVPLIAARIIPYAPLYRASPFIGPTPNLTWLLTTTAFGIIVMAVPLVILISMLERWRVRDAEIHRIAKLDGLTSLANRRYFNERLEAELSRVRRHASSVALLLLDLDHFKRINDRHGHQVGDKVLVEVARLLASDLLRRIDLTGRYGGEEFAVMLPETDLEGAKIVAERLRAAIAAAVLHLPDGNLVRITASFGVGVADPFSLTTLDALVGHADGALYRAKHEGRDRVCSLPLEERASRA